MSLANISNSKCNFRDKFREMWAEHTDTFLAEPFQKDSVKSLKNVEIIKCIFAGCYFTSDFSQIAPNCPHVINCKDSGFYGINFIIILLNDWEAFFVGIVLAVNIWLVELNRL